MTYKLQSKEGRKLQAFLRFKLCVTDNEQSSRILSVQNPSKQLHAIFYRQHQIDASTIKTNLNVFHATFKEASNIDSAGLFRQLSLG